MSLSCPHCLLQSPPSNFRNSVVRAGTFKRKSDQTLQQRFICKSCRKSFSKATFHPCYKQKKRHHNPAVFQLLVSGVSQRRIVKLLGINRKTVVRKFIFLGLQADHYFNCLRHAFPPSQDIQFDDLETFEHSKLKPLSVTMAVENKTRRILGFRVARMPAKGLLVKRALKKYGYRKDERKRCRQELFREVLPFVAPTATISSDENPHYKSDVNRFFPDAYYVQYPGKRGCVVGQGELKAGGFDPLFSLNHTFAMYRANINRLFRRTWNTTKKPERLSLHIALYNLYHNLVLIR